MRKFLRKNNITSLNSTTISPTNNELNALNFLKKNWPIDIIIPKVSDVDGDVAVEDISDGQCSVKSYSYSDGDSDFSTGSMGPSDLVNLDFDTFMQKLKTHKKRKKKIALVILLYFNRISL